MNLLAGVVYDEYLRESTTSNTYARKRPAIPGGRKATARPL